MQRRQRWWTEPRSAYYILSSLLHAAEMRGSCQTGDYTVEEVDDTFAGSRITGSSGLKIRAAVRWKQMFLLHACLFLSKEGKSKAAKGGGQGTVGGKPLNDTSSGWRLREGHLAWPNSSRRHVALTSRPRKCRFSGFDRRHDKRRTFESA